eukprot:symbB.v1.2.035794.t1/scaffold4904.1/size33176/2
MAPPAPTRRRRDTVDRENFAELVDPKLRHLIKAKEFPAEHQGFRPKDVEVVLFDVYSLDSFSAACAARRALGPQTEFQGVTRSGLANLNVDVTDKVVALLGFCWNFLDIWTLMPLGPTSGFLTFSIPTRGELRYT